MGGRGGAADAHSRRCVRAAHDQIAIALNFGGCGKHQRIGAAAVGWLQDERPALICEQYRLEAACSEPRIDAIALSRNGKASQATGPCAPVVDLNAAGIRAAYTDQISRAILAEYATAVGDRNAHGIGRAHGATAPADNRHRAVTDTVDAAVGAADQNADRLIGIVISSLLSVCTLNSALATPPTPMVVAAVGPCTVSVPAPSNFEPAAIASASPPTPVTLIEPPAVA